MKYFYLKEINVSFAGHCIKQHDTIEYLGRQPNSKLNGNAMASEDCYMQCAIATFRL